MLRLISRLISAMSLIIRKFDRCHLFSGRWFAITRLVDNVCILTTLVGSIAAQSASAVAVVGNYAYVADQCGGLKIIDVSNKTNPILVGNIAIHYAKGVTVVGNYAYVADQDGGLKIVDVSNKTSPALVGNITTAERPGCHCRWQLCLCCRWGGGLKIIDVSNKTNPILVGHIATGGPGCHCR